MVVGRVSSPEGMFAYHGRPEDKRHWNNGSGLNDSNSAIHDVEVPRRYRAWCVQGR